VQPADSIATASWRSITELVPLEIPGQCHGVWPPGAGGGKSWTDLPAAWLTTSSRAGYAASAGGAGRSVVDYSILLQQGKTSTDQLLQHSAAVSSSACFQQQPAEMMQQQQGKNNFMRGFATGPSDMMLMSSRSESSSTDPLAAMLASCTPAGALQGSYKTSQGSCLSSDHQSCFMCFLLTIWGPAMMHDVLVSSSSFCSFSIERKPGRCSDGLWWWWWWWWSEAIQQLLSSSSYYYYYI